MGVNWIMPALREGYNHREQLLGLLKGGLSLAAGHKTTIAITGVQGVGKSVLYDFLSGKAYKAGYKLPMQSQKLERGRITTKAPDGKKKLVVSVVPGQKSAQPRFEALDRVFSKTKTNGVIHLFANGFATTRTQHAVDLLIGNGADTIEKYRDLQRQNELDDLEETCNSICEAHRKYHCPSWLIVVPCKLDLYSSEAEIKAAQKHYSLTSDGRIGELLQNLRGRVGSDNIRFDAAPVACRLEAFEWNGSVRKSGLAETARDRYVGQLFDLIVNYCK